MKLKLVWLNIINPLLLLASCSSPKETNSKNIESDFKNKSFNVQDTMDHNITLLYPINAMLRVGERLNLKVDISKDFHVIEGNPMGDYVEFVPKTETKTCWTQNITLQTLVGNRISAKQAVERVKQIFSNDFSYTKVLEESVNHFDTYSHAYAYVLYSNGSEQAIVLINYYSGPFDCSGMQYSIEILNNQTADQVLENLKEFSKNNVAIIKF